MIFSDIDIRMAQGDTLIIEPFEEKNVTAVGYDVSVGNFVYVLGQGLLSPSNGVYRVPSGATIQILTKETMWLSSKLAATIHSRVLLVSRGLAHISTTIDPSWAGPLLITTTNLSKTELALPEHGTFATAATLLPPALRSNVAKPRPIARASSGPSVSPMMPRMSYSRRTLG